MSRIGKRPIAIPPKVEVKIDGQDVLVTGPKGKLSRSIPTLIHVTVQEENTLVVQRVDESRPARQLHGLCRTLVSNMVTGVSTGFQKKLEIQGVGYRASMQGSKLVMNMGYSHPVEIQPPDGIQIAVDNNVNITVSGIDKELVGNIAAQIRSVREPEPYKGKGIRYQGEKVRRKAGKSGKAKK